MNFRGVMPAMTTPFTKDLKIDFDFFGEHCRWMVDAGSTALVLGGSLGEGATVTLDEKVQLCKEAQSATNNSVPVVLAVSALSTEDGVKMAKAAEAAGCKGLMVLPPYVYRGDWRETQFHFSEIIRATGLSCMLYNNPIAYGTDCTPEQIAEIAETHKNLVAVKESSADVRRINGIRRLVGERLEITVGVDDILVEGVMAGAVGWVAGLVNAMPHESVELFELAKAGPSEALDELYHWFLPLLVLDTVPKFVQLIKLVQQEVGKGTETVRPPRLELTGQERAETLKIIHASLAARK